MKRPTVPRAPELRHFQNVVLLEIHKAHADWFRQHALAGNLSIKAQPGGAAHIELIVTQEKCKRGMGSTVVSFAPMGNE